MSLDLNGTATGTNAVTSYIDDTAAIVVVPASVVVGAGSSTSNTDGIDRIRISGNWAAGDGLQIGALPSGLVLSGAGIPSGATSWTGPVQGDVYIQRASPSVTITDLMWQAALQSVLFYNSTPAAGAEGVTAPTRTIAFDTQNASGTLLSHATTTINIDNAPWAVADTATAVEAGGVNNGTAGTDPTGNVLTNDVEPDAGDTKTVSAVSFGATSGTVGLALAGAYGSLKLNADGSYTYTVDNNNATVQGLRTSANTLTETFSYTMRDNAGATSTNTLTVTIRGANDAPVAVADTLHVTEAGGVNNGTGGTQVAVVNILSNDTDVDTDGDDPDGKEITGWSGNISSYGSAQIVSGVFTFIVNNSNAAVQALRSYDDTLTATYDYTMRDTAGATSTASVTVVIHGANDAVVAVADTATAVEAGGINNGTPGTNPGGNVLANDTDVDAGDTKTVTAVAFGTTSGTVGSALAGAYGSLVLGANGSYIYTVDNNNATVQALGSSANTLTETFTYTVSDTAGASSTTTLTVTIQGANDTPVITGTSTGAVTEDTAVSAGNISASGKLNIADVDFQQSSFIAQTAGESTYGAYTVGTDGAWTYTASNAQTAIQSLRAGQTLTDTFAATSWDGTTQLVTITITGTNDAPVATADTTTAVEAGGVNNGTPGTNPTGNVLANDTDLDAGDTKTVSAVAFGATNGTVGSALAGAYGSLKLNADGSYAYTVNNSNATVQAQRTSGNTLTETFSYTTRDAAGATSTSTLTVTVQGANDAPVSASLGQWFSGTAAAVVDPHQNLGASSNFTMEFKVNPTETITLKSQSTTGSVGASGQHYAIWAPQGRVTWGSANDAGIGVSVGTNGISVYQHTDYILAPLLTWAGAVNAETQVAVVFNDKTPTLYINGVAVQTGLQSTIANLHPSTIIGGGSYGYFKGSVSDYHVWDSALSAAQINANLNKGLTGNEVGLLNSQLSTAVAENAAAGAVVGTVRGADVDAGETFTYSLVNNAGGRFTIDATTGVVSVAGGAVLNYEANTSHELVVRVTDGGGLPTDQTIKVRVANVNEAPVAVADTVTAIEAGGVNNGTPGTNPTGYVLTNDVDPDAGDTKVVSAVSFGATSGTVGSALAGAYGSLKLDADGGYTYMVDNSNVSVQALRTGNTLTDTFSYTMRDAAGATSTSTLTVTIQGANDAPTPVAVTADALEAGGVNNSAPGTDPSGTLIGGPNPEGDALRLTDVWLPVQLSNGSWSSLHQTLGPGPGPGSVADMSTKYGTLHLTSSGSYQYIVNNEDGRVQALRTGADTLTETFTYQVADEDGATGTNTLTVVVHGANDAPVAVNDAVNAARSAGVYAAEGDVLANDTDVDSNDSKTLVGVRPGAYQGGFTQVMQNSPLVQAGQYGMIQISSDGHYTYNAYAPGGDPAEQAAALAIAALRPGQTLTDSFEYQMEDAAGLVSTATINVVIQGANDAPVASAIVVDTAVEAGGTNNGTPGNNPEGSVLPYVHDVDANDTVAVSGVSFGATNAAAGSALAGAYGSLTIDENGHYAYTVNNLNAAVQALRTGSDTLTDTFTYTVHDAAGATSSNTLKVVIHGANDAPVATADTMTAVEAGGVNNGTPGTNPTGNVLNNDVEPDAGDTKVVSAVAFGATNGTVGSALAGAYGSLKLNA
ncbi:beta strand repeat-containing protein, partial [Variovorax sp. JS1663]|uniref:beta strand repeat-containing protein n=1 Tax=Variovorax sp. JS1663 TaxID=1851577 RepID=UPI00186491F4